MDNWPVGGVDHTGKVDKISLQIAVETPFWMAVWAAEPTRPVEVSMTYEDLKIICRLIDEKRKERIKRLANVKGLTGECVMKKETE